MSELKTLPGQFNFTLEVKRAATGLVETYEMIGTPIEETEENTNGSNPFNSGS